MHQEYYKGTPDASARRLSHAFAENSVNGVCNACAAHGVSIARRGRRFILINSLSLSLSLFLSLSVSLPLSLSLVSLTLYTLAVCLRSARKVRKRGKGREGRQGGKRRKGRE